MSNIAKNLGVAALTAGLAASANAALVQITHTGSFVGVHPLMGPHTPNEYIGSRFGVTLDSVTPGNRATLSTTFSFDTDNLIPSSIYTWTGTDQGTASSRYNNAHLTFTLSDANGNIAKVWDLQGVFGLSVSRYAPDYTEVGFGFSSVGNPFGGIEDAGVVMRYTNDIPFLAASNTGELNNLFSRFSGLKSSAEYSVSSFSDRYLPESTLQSFAFGGEGQINIVPSASTLGAFGAAGLMASRRRRTVAQAIPAEGVSMAA